MVCGEIFLVVLTVLFSLLHVSTWFQLAKEIPKVVSGYSILLLNLDLYITVRQDLIIEDFCCRHHYFAQRLIKGTGTYKFLKHVGSIFMYLVLYHFLWVPKANISGCCYRDELVLLIVEFEHDDFLNVCVDLAIVLFSRLIDKMYLTRDPTESKQILLWWEIDGAYRATFSPLLLLTQPVIPNGMVQVDTIINLDIASKWCYY